MINRIPSGKLANTENYILLQQKNSDHWKSVYRCWRALGCFYVRTRMIWMLHVKIDSTTKRTLHKIVFLSSTIRDIEQRLS